MSILASVNFPRALVNLTTNKEKAIEIIREFISNAYDAKAPFIWIWSHVAEQTLVFLDSGSGVSCTPNYDGTVPWGSFFSLYSSTKSTADPSTIGEKGVGSKLGFDCEEFWLLSRQKTDPAGEWLCKCIDYPTKTLTPKLDLTPEKIAVADIVPRLKSKWRESLPPDLDEILISLGEQLATLEQGTLIICRKLNIPSSTYAHDFENSNDSRFMREYIRFNTRHGDVLELTAAAGFDPHIIADINKRVKQHKATLYLWKTTSSQSGQLEPVPYGFPYLAVNDEDRGRTALPARLRASTHSHRFAKIVRHQGRDIILILAADGYERIRDNADYKFLGEPRDKRSGLLFDSQRGVVACSKGIKVGTVRSSMLWDNLPHGSRWYHLGDKTVTDHYVLFMEGMNLFEQNLNRSGLTEKALQTFGDREFLSKLESFLEESVKEGSNPRIFDAFVTRSNEDIDKRDENAVEKKLKKRKAEMADRASFKVKEGENDKRVLDRLVDASSPKAAILLVEPLEGEERQVEVLHAHLATRVPEKSPQLGDWYLSRILFGQGIDSLAVQLDDISRSTEVERLRNVEYKVELKGPDISINHPLALLDVVIAWTVSNVSESGCRITDVHKTKGQITKEKAWLYTVSDLTRAGGTKIEKTVAVIDLKELIDATFEVEWFTAKPPAPKKAPKARPRA